MNKSTCFNNSKSVLVLCCVLSAAQDFFHFWRFWAAHSMPCTQDAPLHFMESDDNQPNRKRSHEAAQRLHDTVNRGMVQSIRADGRYFTNPASIDFSYLISSLFYQKILANPVRLESVHSLAWHTIWQYSSESNFNPSILMVGGRECLPLFPTDRMDFCAI